MTSSLLGEPAESYDTLRASTEAVPGRASWGQPWMGQARTRG
jgi:hypothetical protein